MELEKNWERVIYSVREVFNKEPDLKGILFLIGIREQGYGKRKFSKEKKEELMNLAVCRILSISGYFAKKDEKRKDFPVWEQLKPFPKLTPGEQEKLLKRHIIYYFSEEGLI